MGSRVQYEEIKCRSAINRVRGMDFRWSLNPYRGCVHGCHYCFARRFHAYYDLGAGDDFTGVIFVKANMPQVLREELSRPSWGRETVVLGTATDPYQPIEGKYRLTRRCLEAFVEWRSPMSLITKGSMIIRDADVLAELGRRAECTVCFSITTMDVGLARKLEPGTPPPHKRLQALERLAQAGVRTGVSLSPIIPGITDSVADLENVARAAVSHGASFLWGNMLYLKPGTKEHFLDFLKREYPGLSDDYRGLYPDAYAPKRLQSQARRRVDDLKESYGMVESRAKRFNATNQPRQLRLALR